MQLITLPIYILSVLILRAPQPSQSVSEPVDQQVRVMEIGEHEVLPGVIRPTDEAVLSSPFDTLLGELRVAEGQSVSRGQVVAVLDDRVVRAALHLAETQAKRTAQVDHAKAVYDKAKDSLARIRAAYELRAAGESELVAAETDCVIAAADLRNAEEAQSEALASLELARTRHEEHLVRAPFDGTVVRIHAEPGTMLTPGTPLIEIASDDGLCVDLYLPVSIADRLREGEYYALAVEDPKPTVVAACIRYIEPRVDPVSRTIRVVFDLGQVEHSERIYAGVLTQPAARLPLFDTQQLPASTASHQLGVHGVLLADIGLPRTGHNLLVRCGGLCCVE